MINRWNILGLGEGRTLGVLPVVFLVNELCPSIDTPGSVAFDNLGGRSYHFASRL